MSLQSELSRLAAAKADIKAAVERKGVSIPEGTTLDGYAAKIDEISTLSSSLVTFQAAGWTGPNAAGGYTLSIPSSEHKMEGDNWAFRVRHLVDGVYRSGTWAARCVTARMESASGTIILDSEDAFDGSVTFIG